MSAFPSAQALQGCRKMLERFCWDAGHNLVEMPEHVADLLKASILCQHDLKHSASMFSGGRSAL